MQQALQKFAGVSDLRATLAGEYQRQITNFFGDEKKALKFLSSVVASVQKNPKLLECSPDSVINSFMTMAQLELMPSDVSGEAYVLPYNDKRLGMIAQFQLGYQGLVTLFYRAGAKSIHADIVREKDAFSYVNGEITHAPDVFADDRGKAIGAYVIVTLGSGEKIAKVMKAKDILAIGSRFSKSFKSSFTPWNESQDPELWMWKKTVLKQAAKLVPKNEAIFKAVAEDNKDSIVSDQKDRFGGVELPMPKHVAEKKAAKENAVHEVEVGEETTDAEVQTDEDGVVYEEVNDQMPCSKCGSGLTSAEVDACDQAGEEHVCTACKAKATKQTTAKDVIAKRNSLKQNDEKAKE